MQIIREITMHLDRRETTPVVDVVQGETARWLKVALYEKGKAWDIPADATIMIRYRKPDCTGGVYDSYPDGTRAWSFHDNVVEFRIAPQALATAGVTAMQIAIDAQGEELASFIFHLRVESDPSVGTKASDDYINIGQWLMPRIYQFVSEAEAAAALAARSAEEAALTAAGVSSRYLPTYFAGCVDPVEGVIAESASAIASEHFPLLNDTLGVAFSELVTVRLYYYDQALRFLGADLMRTESFELDAPAGAKFARIEIRYASGMSVYEVAALAKYVTLYIPNTSAADAQRAENAASQAFLSADRANTAADLAQSAVKNCVKTVNGISPDENGNVSVTAGGGNAEPMQYLQLESRKLMGYNMHALYNGTEFKQAEVPMGFTCIEPSEYNGQSNILKHHLSNMPAMLNGVFKATEQSEEEHHFQYAYAFSGGFADFDLTSCMVLEPESGKIWHFDFADGSVKTSAIGESGGGGTVSNEWRLVRSITLEQDVSEIVITTDDNGNPLKLNEAFIKWTGAEHTQTSGTCGMNIKDINGASTGTFAVAHYINESKNNAWFLLDRYCDGLRVTYNGGKPSKNNDYVRGSGTILPLTDIARISLIAHAGMFVAGSTLKLYARG